MPSPLRCSLNVTFHFWGEPMLQAMDGASSAGFSTIELLDPYGMDLDDLERALKQRGLNVDVINLPMGDFYAGERGFAGDPRRRARVSSGCRASRQGRRPARCHQGQCAQRDARCRRVRGDSASLPGRTDRLGRREAGAERGVSHGGVAQLARYARLPRRFARPCRGSAGGPSWPGRLPARPVPLAPRRIRAATDDLEVVAPVTGHYQIADAPGRTEPGSGEIEFGPVLDAISAAGYDGIIGCEFRPSQPDIDAFAWMEGLNVIRA